MTCGSQIDGHFIPADHVLISESQEKMKGSFPTIHFSNDALNAQWQTKYQNDMENWAAQSVAWQEERAQLMTLKRIDEYMPPISLGVVRISGCRYTDGSWVISSGDITPEDTHYVDVKLP